jgi:hypothetical protein
VTAGSTFVPAPGPIKYVPLCGNAIGVPAVNNFGFSTIVGLNSGEYL